MRDSPIFSTYSGYNYRFFSIWGCKLLILISSLFILTAIFKRSTYTENLEEFENYEKNSIFKKSEIPNIVYNISINNQNVKFSKSSEFVPPLLNLVTDYYLAPAYKILACGIRKSMSQLTFNIMCLLKDHESYLSGRHSLNDTWDSNRTCKYEIQPQEILESSDYAKFALIRDPFDRFISLYLDKCVNEHLCYDCYEDMQCVARKLYESLISIKNRRPFEKIYPSFMDMHGAPVSWMCNFENDLENVHTMIAGVTEEHRKSMVFNLVNFLKSKNVPEDLINVISKEALVGETLHSTHKSERRIAAEKQVQEDQIVREYLHKIYFYDYLVFPFNKTQLDPEYRTDFWKLP